MIEAVLAGIGLVVVAVVIAFFVLAILLVAFGTGEVTVNGQRYVRLSSLKWWRRDKS